jgi:hypothetical protein
MENSNGFYLDKFRVKRVERIKDSEGKEEKILLYLETNNINITNSKDQVIISSETKIRKN